jgi:hypothetical protein
MKRVEANELVVLLMDIESPETPFFSETGSIHKAMEVSIDPNMPSGYAVKIATYGGLVLVDRSAVIHHDDYKRLHNAVIKRALEGARL